MAGSGGSGGMAGRPESSPANTEPPDGLVIRAIRAHEDVAANPDLFRPVAEALVAEARQARQPEALALALRALALAEQSRLNDAAATFGRQTRAAFRARAVIVAAEARLRAGTGGAEELRRAAVAARLLASTGSTAAAVQGFLVTGRLAAALDR